MKRVISLFCVCLILVMSLSVPARADSVINYDRFNVLDFSTNQFGHNYFAASSGDVLSYSLPESGFILYYVDLLVYSVSPILSANIVTYDGLNLSVEPVGDQLYRLFGTLNGWVFTSLDISFSFQSSGSVAGEILSFYASTIKSAHYDIDAYCDIVSADFSDTIHYVPADDINHRIFMATDDFNETFFYCYIWADQWRKYDYIDFQLMFDCFSITSVSAVMGSINVPLDVSFIDGTSIDGNSFYLTMRMDLTGLDRTSSDYPMIVLMGRLDSGVLNSIDFANCSGYVITDSVSPFFYYFNSLKVSISSNFNNLLSFFRSYQESIWANFQELKNNISNNFIWLMDFFEDYQLSIWANFSEVKANIDRNSSSIISAIRGDTDPGDDFQDQVDQKDQELEDMAAVMDSVTKPDIQDINVSLDQYVKPADVQLLATPLTVFLEADLFRTMIIMSILLATVSFTLYGKR